MTTVSQHLAAYIRTARPAEPLLTHGASRAFLDTLAAAVAGRDEPSAAAAGSWARTAVGRVEGSAARDWATGISLPVAEAAFVNGVASHALDLDDVSMAMWGHPSTLLVPVAIAIGEATGASVKQCLAAYVVGLHVDVAMSAGFNLVEHYARGWHASVTVGTIGAVATGAHLLGLSEQETVSALGMAVSMASGSRENFGTTTKPMHIGFAASNAVKACQLAAAGVDASPTAIDGPLGFFQLYGAGGGDAAAVVAALHSRESTTLATLNTKRYPCCYQTHRAIDAALDLHAGLDPQARSEISEVVVYVNPGSDNSLIHPFARTPAQARFCMRYVVSAALLFGKVDFATFAPEHVADPAVQELMQRVRIEYEETPPFGERAYKLDYASLQVTTPVGEPLRITCTVPRGNEERPLDDDDLLVKADSCLRHGEFDAGARRIFAALTDPLLDTIGLVDQVRSLDRRGHSSGPAWN